MAADERLTESRAIETRGLRQEEPYASRPGPLMRMAQAVRAAQTCDVLIIRSADFGRELTDLYNEAHYGSAAQVSTVTSWKGLLAELRGWQVVRRLVLLVDSTPSMLLFNRLGGAASNLFADHIEFDRAARELAALGGKPRIGSVDLDNCNAGRKVATVLRFGLAAGADEIVATNHFHEFAMKRFTAMPGGQVRLAEQFGDFAGYLTTPSLRGYVGLAAKQRVDRVFLLEWYVEGAGESSLPLPEEKKRRTAGFKPRDSAQPYVVQTAQDAQSLQTAIDTTHDFIRYVVRLGGFRRSQNP